ncbi:uncharacterized protein [Henckelia pumila]|uniref:uncharacterized protein n=1 Tax=Henckelia pumila TaxID=405737 RepID=UPI003C6E5398
MEGRNGPVTDYRSSASAAYPLPNSLYNYQPNPYHHRPVPLPDGSTRRKYILPLFLIALVALFFALFYYEKRRPDFRLDSFSLSNFTITNGSHVSMIAQVKLTGRNPNYAYSLDYDHIVTSICYKHQQLSQAFVPPFSQEKKHKTSLVAEFSGDGIIAVDKWVVDGIHSEIEANNGRVGFDFWLISSIAWDNDTSRADTLKVLCRDLAVDIPTNGSAAGRLTAKPKTCQVRKSRDALSDDYDYDYDYLVDHDFVV